MIEELDASALAREAPALAAVLRGCVATGASVGFLLPFGAADAGAFWRGLLPSVEAGERRVLAARLDGHLVGTVQLVLAGQLNGQHRAEVAKLLVHPEFRRRGVARALMLAAETLARRLGRTLLLLDTRRDGGAESLYLALGWHITGTVPRFARISEGGYCDTVFMHKDLEAA